MNFVRRIVNRGKKGTEENQFSAEKTLCLQHLRKLFLEFLHPPETDAVSQEQQENRLFLMLPLFLRVFSDLEPVDMSERFGDVLQFAGHTSKLLVNEIQRRAANRDCTEGSEQIIDFLIQKHCDQANGGWNLICALNILSQGEIAIIECMVAAALPSVLVKTISIFFSLPAGYRDDAKVNEVRNQLIPTLARLCHHPITAKELIRTDDLAILFSDLTRSYRQEHIIWRTGVSEVLSAITRYCFTREVIEYISEKLCISLCIASMRGISTKDPMAVVEMFVTLACVLKDSADVSSELMDCFTECKGYQFLMNLLLEFAARNEESVKVAGRNLVLLISSLVLTGHQPLSPSLSLEAPFQNQDYKIPTPSLNSGVTVRNFSAFEVLLSTFLQVEDEDLSLQILRAVQHIFNSDPANYFILITHHPVTQLIQKASEKSTVVQLEVFKLVEFVALQLHWVPTQELMAIGLLFKNKALRSCQAVALHTLIRLVNQEGRYKEIFRDCGLLELLTNALKTYSDSLKESANDYSVLSTYDCTRELSDDPETETDYIFLLMECIRLLVENDPANAACFHQSGGSRCAHNLIPYKKARPYAIKIIQQLIIDGGHDDLGTLLGLMHSTQVTDVSLKSDVLASLIRIFAMNGNTRRIFQEVGGFVYVVSLLVSLEGSLTNPPGEPWEIVKRESILELIWQIFQVLTAAMQDEPINKTIFMDKVRFKGLTDTIRLLGCFPQVSSELPPMKTRAKNCKQNGTNQRKNRSFIKLPSVLDISMPDVTYEDPRFVQLILFKSLLSMACGIVETLDMQDTKTCMTLLSTSTKVPKIIYPRAITAMFELIPLLWNEGVHDVAEPLSGQEVTSDIMFYIVSELQHLLSGDQNQQLMCDSGLPQVLLSNYRSAFMDEEHLLNAPNAKLFERLATQSLTADMLRLFLRMASPLCCKSPYALLRRMTLPKEKITIDESCSDIKDNRQSQQFRNRSMSFTYMDGDIRLSYNMTTLVSIQDSSFITEENELHSFDDEDPSAAKDAASPSFTSPLEMRRARENGTLYSPSGSGVDLLGLQAREETDSVSINSASVNYETSETLTEDISYSVDSLDGELNGRSSLSTSMSNVFQTGDHNIYRDDNSTGLMFEAENHGSTTPPESRTSHAVMDEEALPSSLVTSTPKALNPRSKDTLNIEQVDESLNPEEEKNYMESGQDTLAVAVGKEEVPSVKNETKNGLAKKHTQRDDTLSNIEKISQSLVETYTSQELSRQCDKLEGFNPPQNLVKCLVSLLTPRDVLNVTSNEPPAFVEFDCSQDGYGCLYLASITPQGIQVGSSTTGNTLLAYSPTSVVAIGAAAGGASGDRSFPPQIGLTFMAWLCIETIPSPASDCYIRLLTVQRKWEDLATRTPHVATIFSIYVDLESKELVVSTEEHENWSDRSSWRGHTMEARVSCDTFLEEGTWNHYAITLNRNVMKSSTATVYVNGNRISTVKVKYIQTGTPQGMDIASYRTVAFLGSHPYQCHVSNLIWRLGPFYLLEDPLLDDNVSLIAGLGPSYLGCFQSPVMSDYFQEDQTEEVQSALISEEKVSFALNAHNLSTTTLSKVKMQYSAGEAKAIADEMSLQDGDKYTPLSIIWNSALHLQGAARSIGAILLGSSGVRTFCPNSVAAAFMSVGGVSVLLSLVAMAKNLEELYASLKALACILQSSRITRKEMGRLRGYQILGFLLKKKKHLLNTHILHLIFSLVGTVRSDRESGCIPNISAFKDLLCDLEIWHGAPSELERSLYSHFFELITQGSESARNLACLRNLGVLPLLLHVLADGKPPDPTLHTIASVGSVLLRKNPQNFDLLRFGQFLANTLPPSSHSEKYTIIEENWIKSSPETYTQYIASDHMTQVANVHMRNVLLDVLNSLLHGSSDGSVDSKISELIHDVLGFDWVLLFFSSHIHKLTVIRAARILFTMLGNQVSLGHFQNGTSNGGWLEGTKQITKRKTRVAAGFNVPESEESSYGYVINVDICSFKGFPMLMTLLEEHVDVTEIYYLLFALLLGYPVAEIPSGLNVTVQTLYLLFWPAPFAASSDSNQQRNVPIYCPDACLVLLHMTRKIIDKQSSNESLNEIPSVVIQFLEFLYRNVKQFNAFCTGKKFLQYLAATLFPMDVKDENDGLEVADDLVTNVFHESYGDMSYSLTSHTAAEHIINFIKIILLDAMQNQQTKPGLLLDLVLEAYPSSATPQLQKKYQTTILCAVIDDIKNSNLMQVPGSGAQFFVRYASNLSSFASKVVDKLWIGAFIEDYKIVFDLVTYLITRLDSKQWGVPVNVDELFASLNRVVLYQFSRPQARITDQTSLLEFLHLLTLNSRLIFTPSNKDSVFLASVIHWLLVIRLQQDTSDNELDESDTEEEIEQKDQVLPDTDNILEDSSLESYISDNGCRPLILAASERVWNVFYQHKKDEIEDIFKLQASTPSFTTYEKENVALGAGRPLTLDLKSAKSMLGEQAAKVWMSFISAEEKKRAEAWSSGSQTTTKRISVARISRKLKKEKSTEAKICVREALSWNTMHLAAVKALVTYHLEKHHQECLLNFQSAEKSWRLMEIELLRERGIWGPQDPSPLEKWSLDMTEGPFRMRKRLVKNDAFYLQYPYRASASFLSNKYRTASSKDSTALFQVCQKYLTVGNRVSSLEADSFSWSPKFSLLDDFESESTFEQVNSQTIVQLLEAGEKIYSMYRCARVQGLDSAEGLILFGKGRFYIIDGFTLLSTENKDKAPSREIKDIDSLPEKMHEPLIPPAKGNGTLERSFIKIGFDEISEVYRRRYILQDISMEIFCHDGSNHLLVFPKKVARDKIYARCQRMCATSLTNAQESVVGMKADADVEAGHGLFGSLMGEKSVTQRWERGDISNFQYLMYLNSLAGRSYNDLMQYPVFPWILADYTSEELDLTSPSTFRDLSLPMGAQEKTRLDQFLRRYNEWEDTAGDTPAYYYGTHYSSAMIVASYLIRMEPFTQHFLRLQGGHFDLPDRLFHSVKDAWLSASETNMADVKELIPEFFYLPEFLINSNNFDFGTKQNGDVLHDVVLPPWAKGDPREFIRVHRKALECDYVSAHLHEWIDLVFGYKQSGPAAAECHNVFHHLFYEGAVDLDQIEDKTKKNATIGFIHNFGQMPRQLFKRPHPRKRINIPDTAVQTGTLPNQVPVNQDKLFFHNFPGLVPTVQPIKELRAPVGEIILTDRSLCAVEKNKALLTPSYTRYISWGFGDFSLRFCTSDDKVLAVFEDVFVGRMLCAASLANGIFVTGGSCTALCVWQIEKPKEKGHKIRLIKVLYGHNGAVTCVTASLTYNLIVSGSEDKSVIIWDSRKLVFIRQLSSHNGPITAVAINSLSGDIVTCAGTWMYLWNVNGHPIVQENTSAAVGGQILCCTFSELNEWDEDNVILTGSADGVVRMWGVEFFDAARSSGLRRMIPKSTKNTPVVSEHAAEIPKREEASEEENEETPKEEEADAVSVKSVVTEDDFVFVQDAHGDSSSRERDWKRRLVLKHKLTMHTAYGRYDNSEPAPVTALAVSKDHRKIYVGDGRGRIFVWSVSDSPGRIADHWLKDEGAERCCSCDVKFTFAERRHHCRNCGKIFCARCSRFESPIEHLKIFKPVRVCRNCYIELKRSTSSDRQSSKSEK